jgi:hypothetical protein
MKLRGLRATVRMMCLLLSIQGATSAKGPYHFEWFDPSTHETIETGQKELADGSTRFTPPVDGTAVLYLKSTTDEENDS